jgi:DNA-binding MarR family transcriptional regulator
METSRQHLLDAIGTASREFQRSVDAVDDAVAKQLRVNRTDLRTLDVLFDGPASPGALAAATGMSPAAMTTALDRLEVRGFVRRVRDTADRRRLLVEVTELAERVAGQLYGPIAAEGMEFVGRYSDAQLALLGDFLRTSKELQDRHRERIVVEKLDGV